MNAFPSLYFSTLFLVMANGLLTTYLGLYLVSQSTNTTWIGLMISIYYIGLITGSKIGHWIVSRVGHIRAFAASTGIAAACAAVHGLTDNTVVWLVLRFIVGISMMCNFMVLESWLNEQADPTKRGNVFANYMLASYFGMISGQVALSFFPDLGIKPILLITMCFSLCVVPLALTKGMHPTPLTPTKSNLLYYWKNTPQSLTTVLFGSMISGCFYGLTPAYVSSIGLDNSQISTYMSVTILAGLLAQWPMGKLSDKWPRSQLIRLNAVIIFSVVSLLWLLPFNYLTSLCLTFIFGLVTFTLYPLASALANSRINDKERVGLSAALLVTFGMGASTGPFLASTLMNSFGNSIMYAYMATAALVMFILLNIINYKQKAEKPGSSDYIVTSGDIVSSPLAAVIDPRVDQDMANEQLLKDDKPN